LLTDTKLAIGNGGLGTAWHAFHVKKCPLPEIITKAPHLGKYFLKEPQMGKFATHTHGSLHVLFYRKLKQKTIKNLRTTDSHFFYI